MKKKINKLFSQFFKKYKLITAIFVLGLILRLWGTYPGYPLIHADEPIIQSSSVRMALNLDFKPQANFYGQLLPLIYALTYVIFYIPLSFITMLPDNAQYLSHGPLAYISRVLAVLPQGKPLHQQDIFSINYWGRYDSAILSAFTVLAVYLVGKRFFNKPIALAAAFFTAINYRHVLSSKLILADAPASLFALLAIFFCANLLKNRSWRTYLFTAISLAFALSVKYFIYVIPVFFYCHTWPVLRKKNYSWLRRIREIISPQLFITLFVTALIFIAINPYFLITPKESLEQWTYNAARYGLHLSLSTIHANNISYYVLYTLYYYGLGPILTILTFLGIIVSFIRYPKGSFIISLAAFPYIYTFLVISGTGFTRNYSAVIPFLLFFPAVFLYEAIFLTRRFTRNSSKVHFGVFALLVVFAGYQSFHNSIRASLAYSQQQNMISLRSWIQDVMPNGSTILAPSGIFYPSEKDLNVLLLNTKEDNLPSLSEISKQQVDWIIMESIPQQTTEDLMVSYRKLMKQALFDRYLPQRIASQMYSTLIFNELSDYRTATFAKPFSQDPSYIVIKIPKNWQATKGIPTQTFSFKEPKKASQWTTLPALDNSYAYEISDGMLRIQQNSPQCNNIISQYTSPNFTVSPQKWYTLETTALRQTNQSPANRNGFLRIDFYDSSDILIKTYVTNPLKNTGETQILRAAGLSPQNAIKAKVVFETDSCLAGERYTINSIAISETEKVPINTNDFPFYMKLLPEGFEWVPQP